MFRRGGKMNEKNNRNYLIAIIILSGLFAISIGFNIGLGRSVSDNHRLRDIQRELERTVAELTAERDAERAAIGELRNLNTEAAAIVSEALQTNAAAGASLARANEILRTVITALQNLDLLYSGGDGSGADGVDPLGG